MGQYLVWRASFLSPCNLMCMSYIKKHAWTCLHAFFASSVDSTVSLFSLAASRQGESIRLKPGCAAFYILIAVDEMDVRADNGNITTHLSTGNCLLIKSDKEEVVETVTEHSVIMCIFGVTRLPDMLT